MGSFDQSIHGSSLIVFGLCAAAVAVAGLVLGIWWLAALMVVASVAQIVWGVRVMRRLSRGEPEPQPRFTLDRLLYGRRDH